MGHDVLVKLYRPKAGSKECHGRLVGYDNGRVTLESAGEMVTFEPKEVALVRLTVEF